MNVFSLYKKKETNKAISIFIFCCKVDFIANEILK